MSVERSGLPIKRARGGGEEDLPQRRRRVSPSTSTGEGSAQLVSDEQMRQEFLGETERIEEGRSFTDPAQEFEHWEAIRRAVMETFIDRTTGSNATPVEDLKGAEAYMALVTDVLNSNEYWARSVSPVDFARLVELLRTYQFGYGPLADFMSIEGLEELYFNNYHQGYYILRGAKRKITQQVFKSHEDLIEFVKRVAVENELEFNIKQANIDATLKDGSRLNATLPPLAVDGPDLVIRKHREIPWTVPQMQEAGTLTDELATDINNWVRGGLNIVVSGGTASGKTSFLNALGNGFLPADDRLIVIENRKELQIYTQDTKYFQTREDATRADESKDITPKEVIRWALRKRPDRIILGELRGGEAFDAMTAWNSGHDGSMCTIHANSARESLSKLEQLSGFNPTRPSESAVRSLISESVDLVVQLSKSRDGTRRVDEVLQVLHPHKHDSLDPAIESYVTSLRDKQLITQQRVGSDDIQVTPLYRADTSGELKKLAQLVPLQGKAAR